MKQSADRSALLTSVVLLLAVALYLVVPRASRDERLYAALRQTQSAMERIETAGGKSTMRDWVCAVSHLALMDPEIYYREKLEAVKQALVASGYLVKVTARVHGLQVQTNQLQLMLKMRSVGEQTDAWYESRFDFNREEVSVLCRRSDVQRWEQALKPD